MRLAVTTSRPTEGMAPYSHIHSTARLYIGLRQSTELSQEEIAQIMEVTPIQLAAFHERIVSNKHARYALQHGLPSFYGESIESTARCKTCRRMLSQFPCVSCCQLPSYEPRNIQHPSLQTIPLPTASKPGSIQKVAVMAARVELGLEPFCDGDVTIYAGSWTDRSRIEQAICTESQHSATPQDAKVVEETFENAYPEQFAEHLQRLSLCPAVQRSTASRESEQRHGRTRKRTKPASGKDDT